MLYHKPVSELMIEAVESLPETFAPSDIVAWFGQQYPRVKETTVRAHIIGLTANDPSRHHYVHLARKPPLFFKIDRARLTRFDPDRHLGEEIEPDLDLPVVEGHEDRMEFYLETYLEEFLLANWHLVDWGRPLEIWRGPKGESGHQLSTPVGRLDFLCIDRSTDTLVVVELKRGLSHDHAVGQAARYMGWVRTELARPEQPVEGLILAHEFDDRLHYAVSVIPGLALLRYDVAFSLEPARRGSTTTQLS